MPRLDALARVLTITNEAFVKNIAFCCRFDYMLHCVARAPLGHVLSCATWNLIAVSHSENAVYGDGTTIAEAAPHSCAVSCIIGIHLCRLSSALCMLLGAL